MSDEEKDRNQVPPAPPYLGRSLKVARTMNGLKSVEVYTPLSEITGVRVTAPRLTDMESGRRPIAMELLPEWKRLVGWEPVYLDFTIAALNFPDAEIEIVVHLTNNEFRKFPTLRR